jgi:hypothetical protein
MSWQSQEAVYSHSRSRGCARLVLLVIASHADEHGTRSFPSLKTIMQKANASERAVQYALKELIASGELLCPQGFTATSDHPYVVQLPHGEVESADFAPTPSADIAPSEEVVQILHSTVQELHSSGADFAPETVQILHSLSADFAQEPSLNPQTLNPPLTPLNPPRERAGALRAMLAGSAAEDVQSEYANFEAFFLAFWQAIPRQSRVDKPLCRQIARDLPPSKWGRVVRSARHYDQSTIVKRGRARNAANFLGGDSWEAYEEGPIVEQEVAPQNQAKPKGQGVIDMANIARERQQIRDAHRSNGHHNSQNGLLKGG